ncbi:MAG: hypothetical protein KAW12_05150 [Candidatus Aminicenantes bacterium]|nr:hypothetical protein [Candidatus Aminicenantes bacterium]
MSEQIFAAAGVRRTQPMRSVFQSRKAYRSTKVFGGVGTFFQKGSDSPKANLEVK